MDQHASNIAVIAPFESRCACYRQDSAHRRTAFPLSHDGVVFAVGNAKQRRTILTAFGMRRTAFTAARRRVTGRRRCKC